MTKIRFCYLLIAHGLLTIHDDVILWRGVQEFGGSCVWLLARVLIDWWFIATIWTLRNSILHFIDVLWFIFSPVPRYASSFASRSCFGTLSNGNAKFWNAVSISMITGTFPKHWTMGRHLNIAIISSTNFNNRPHGGVKGKARNVYLKYFPLVIQYEPA